MSEQSPAEASSGSTMTKVSVLGGIILSGSLHGIPFVWGNLSVYAMSYYYTRVEQSSLALLRSWLGSMFVLGYCLGISIGKPLTKWLNIRVAVFLWSLVFSAAVFLSYFSVKHSEIAMCVTFGLMTGLSTGVIQSLQLILIVRWTDHYKGLATSSLPSFSILGAMVANWMLTAFINPQNEQPDLFQNNMKLFSQKDILDRLPQAFLWYGLVSICLNLVGFALIREEPGDKNLFAQLWSRFTKSSKDQQKIQLRSSSSRSISYNTSSTNSSIEQTNETEIDTVQSTAAEVNSSDVTPMQALKLKKFYVIWFFVVAHTYGFYILNNYYKIFGLLYISDDQFLTSIVMVKCLCTPVATWLAGFAFDRFEPKFTTVILATLFCISSSFFYLTPTNKWLYLFACTFYGCSGFSMHCLASSLCFKYFGESHFTTILGMILNTIVVITLVQPLLCEWILSNYGWFDVFITVGFIAFINVLCLVCLLPDRILRSTDRRQSDN